MLLSQAIISTALLACTSNAAFFYVPEWMSVEDKTSATSVEGRELEWRASEAESSVGSSLKLVQRAPGNSPVAADRVRERFSRKYQHAGPVKNRDNTYSIMTAATPSQSSSAGINQDGTDYSYFAQVQVGSSNTPMYLLLDTGAGSSWVMGTDCDSAACQIHNQFDPTKSTSYKSTADSFAIFYGSGNVSGRIVTDTFSLDGMKIPMTFGNANTTSDDFKSFPIDGILGLSLAKSTTSTSFVEALVASKTVKSNVFGVSLNRAADGSNTGEINFGAPDTSKYLGDLSYSAVSTDAGGYWALPLGNVGVGSKQTGISNKLAFLDTGTSFIFCSEDDSAAFHSLVPGAHTVDNVTYTVPCTTADSATFSFGGKTYSVPTKDWISPEVGGVCTSNIYVNAIASGQWLLGDTFLKNVYTLFDIDQTRVGLAQKNAVTATSSTSESSTMATSSSGTSSPSGTGSASTATSTSGPSTSSSGVGSLGLDGNESSTPSAAVAESTSTTQATPTKSDSRQLRSSLYATSVLVLFLLAL